MKLLPSNAFSINNVTMMTRASRLSIVPHFLSVGILIWLQPPAFAQVSFNVAPVTSDFGGNPSDGDAEGSDGSGGGLGIFARKPFKMSVSLRQGYDSNPNTLSSGAEGSLYSNVGAGVNYSFGSPRLQLGASLSGGATFYYNRGDDPIDYNGNISLSAKYRATPRLNLSLSTSTAYLSQPDIAQIGGTNRQDGDYILSNTTLSASYQWSEIISTVTSYNFSANYYLESDLNDNLGNISQTLAQSVLWLWKPKTTLVAEYRANAINYYSADLNQFGNYFLVGFDQIFNPRFFWNARLGAQLNLNNNPVDGNSTYIGPFMESTLRYQFRPASAVSWIMRYGTEQSGLFDVSQRQTFRTGITLNHAFTARISGVVSVNYLNNYYSQGDVISAFNENIVDAAVGLSYRFNRFVSFETGYQFTIDIAPEDTGRNYTRNIVFVGANFAF